jgi:hypothetical protein
MIGTAALRLHDTRTTALLSLAKRAQFCTRAVNEKYRGVLSYISVQSQTGFCSGRRYGEVRLGVSRCRTKFISSRGSLGYPG